MVGNFVKSKYSVTISNTFFYSHELLWEGTIIRTVSTILSVDCLVAVVNVVTDGIEPVELGDIIDASQLDSLSQSQCAVAKEM